jgi:hypothetical protein
MLQPYQKVLSALSARMPAFAAYLTKRTGQEFKVHGKPLKYDSATVKVRFVALHKGPKDEILPEYFLHIKAQRGLAQLDVTAGASDGSGRITDQKIFANSSLADLNPNKMFSWVRRKPTFEHVELTELLGTLAAAFGAYKGFQKLRQHARQQTAAIKARSIRSPEHLAHEDDSAAGPNIEPNHLAPMKHFPDAGSPERDPHEAPPPAPNARPTSKSVINAKAESALGPIRKKARRA